MPLKQWCTFAMAVDGAISRPKLTFLANPVKISPHLSNWRLFILAVSIIIKIRLVKRLLQRFQKNTKVRKRFFHSKKFGTISVPRKVLKKRYETQIEPDEVQQTQLQPDHDELYDDDQFYRESDGLSTSLKIQSPVHQDTSYSLDTHLRAKNSDSTKFPPTSSHNMHSTFEGKLK